ncbi:MAG: HYR domain-containing protein, partial [Chloroflexi bacterium]
MRTFLLTLASVLGVSLLLNAQVTLTPSLPATADCDGTVTVEIVADGFTDILSAQFSVNWDPAILDYGSYTDGGVLAGALYGTMNTASGQFSISWLDATFAGVTLPAGTVLFSITFDVVGSAGNSTMVSVTGTPVAIEFIDTGFNSVPVTPGSGTTTIQDNVAPTITCPANQTVVVAPGVTSTVVNGIGPLSSSDNCGIQSVTYTLSGATTGSGNDNASGQTFNLGTTTVTYTATDYGNNTGDCSFTVTVSQAGGGNLTLITQSANVDCGSTASVDVVVQNFVDIASLQFSVNWDPAVLSFSTTSNLNLAGALFGTANTGSGELTFSWADPAGQTLPDNSTIFTIEFNVVGGVGTSSQVAITGNPLPIEAYNNAVPPVPLTVDVQSGTLTVQDNVDPTISCPADQTVTVGTGNTSAVVGGIAPVASDNCSLASVTYTLSGATTGSGNNDASGQTFNLGVTTVTYTATDDAGNTASCSFTVTVQQATVPGALTLIAGGGDAECDASNFMYPIQVENFTDITSLQFSINWDPAVLSYNSTSNLILSGGLFGTADVANGKLTFSWFDAANPTTGTTLADGTTIFTINFSVVAPAGANTNVQITNDPLTIEATQAQGGVPVFVPVNTTNGTTNIVDSTPPMIANCPADIATGTDAGMCSAVVTWTAPTASDNCNLVSFVSNFNPGNAFPLGTTTVTYTATDGGGNIATCSFNITVTDDEAPVIANCPANITQGNDVDFCGANVSFGNINGTDNCDLALDIYYYTTGATVMGSAGTPLLGQPTGEFYNVGVTTVHVFAQDDAGNKSAECVFTITVNDTQDPMAVCQDVTISLDAAGNASITAADVDGGSTDNCTISSMSVAPDAFTCANLGDNPVMLTVSDDAGNTATCAATVTVEDNMAPNAVCQDVTVQLDATGNASIAAA